MTPDAQQSLNELRRDISAKLYSLSGADYREVVEELEDHLAVLRMAYDESEPE